MKYKMIAMDMDGTLLNSNKEISNYTKRVLNEAANRGIKLVICTGRIFTSARIYANLIGTAAPVVASNGAYIREKDKNEIIYSKTLHRDDTFKIIKIAKEMGFYPHIFTWNTIYSEKLIYSSKAYTKWNESLPDKDKVRIEIVDDLSEIIAAHESEILKVVVISEEGEKLRDLRKHISQNHKVTIVSSLDNNIEIMSQGISKGNAVKILAEYFNIARDEVICIGDNENDLSMIQYAGLGVAMKNSSDVLIEAADYITDGNDEDGVAKVIERFMLR